MVDGKEGRVMEIREGRKLDQVKVNQRIEELFVREIQQRDRNIAYYRRESEIYAKSGYPALAIRQAELVASETVKKAVVQDLHASVIRTINWETTG